MFLQRRQTIHSRINEICALKCINNMVVGAHFKYIGLYSIWDERDKPRARTNSRRVGWDKILKFSPHRPLIQSTK